MRTFVVVADKGQFQEAADELAVTQQAVSKRIAGLERDVGVRLFNRTARGATLTIDGQAFLPHAREVLLSVERASSSVRPDRRALRIDVINRRIAPALLLKEFYRGHPEFELDVVTLSDLNAEAAIDAVRAGVIDATFRAIPLPQRHLPDGVNSTRVVNDPLQLLIGPKHQFASANAVSPAQLAGHRIWIPGIVAGTEWSAFYDELAASFDLTIDAFGPNFGTESLQDAIADSAELATLVGAGDRYVWPAGQGLRRVPLHDPTPVYPHSILWRGDNPHPGLLALRQLLAARSDSVPPAESWLPRWANSRQTQG